MTASCIASHLSVLLTFSSQLTPPPSDPPSNALWFFNRLRRYINFVLTYLLTYLHMSVLLLTSECFDVSFDGRDCRANAANGCLVRIHYYWLSLKQWFYMQNGQIPQHIGLFKHHHGLKTPYITINSSKHRPYRNWMTVQFSYQTKDNKPSLCTILHGDIRSWIKHYSEVQFWLHFY